MSTFKAVIFDLGKVVFDLSFDRVFQSWANSSGRHFEEIKSRFVFDELFEKFERNECTPEQFRASISKRLDLKISDQEFDKGWCDLYLECYPRIDQLLEHLKSKYKLVALTNTNIIHNATWRNKYSNNLQYFEKIFSSHEMGARKPEERSFKIVLDYLNYHPGETIFLDDNNDNITGAKKLGIATILVNSQIQMKEDLLAKGLLNGYHDLG